MKLLHVLLTRNLRKPSRLQVKSSWTIPFAFLTQRLDGLLTDYWQKPQPDASPCMRGCLTLAFPATATDAITAIDTVVDGASRFTRPGDSERRSI